MLRSTLESKNRIQGVAFYYIGKSKGLPYIIKRSAKDAHSRVQGICRTMSPQLDSFGGIVKVKPPQLDSFGGIVKVKPPQLDSFGGIVRPRSARESASGLFFIKYSF